MPEADDQGPTFELLLRLGDNDLILAQRLGEWVGHAPVLEEDIAVANVALDLVGQTQLWLGLAGELEGKGRSADDLAYLREEGEYRNALLVEQPNGDYGQTLMRQFLFDAWHLPMLQGLMASTETRIAEIAEKATKEATYHLERSTDMVVRLGDGSDESHRRMQAALDLLWPYAGELLTGDETDRAAAAAGLAPLPDDLRPAWDAHVDAALAEATLTKPDSSFMHQGGKRGVHSEHMGYILADLQYLQRAHPGAEW